jgi:hypothetical protein
MKLAHYRHYAANSSEPIFILSEPTMCLVWKIVRELANPQCAFIEPIEYTTYVYAWWSLQIFKVARR